jgi:hypothetical protein
MKTTLKFFATILIISITKIALSQSVTFERYYDFGGNYVEEGYCVQPTSDGGYIVAGRQGVSLGQVNLLLHKIDAQGQTQWYKSIGSLNTWTWACSIKQTTDSGFIATGLHSDINGQYSVYLLKTNSIGDTLWSKKYILTNQNAMTGNDVVQTPDGGYLVLADVVDSNNPVWTPYLVKTNATGDSIWTKKYQRAGGLQAGCLKPTSDGGYIIPAYTSPSSNDNNIYLLKIDSICDTLWTKLIKRIPGYAYSIRRTNCIDETMDGGYFITGTISNLSNVADADIFAIKTNLNGDTTWTKRVGGVGEEYGWAGGMQTSDGGYTIMGLTSTYGNGLLDAYLVKINGIGNTQWYKTFGGHGHDYVDYIMPTPDNGFIISGMTINWGDGGSLYLIKTDSTGYAPSGINFELNKNTEMLIYPNPFISSTTIKIESTYSEQRNFIVFDSFGRIVEQIKIENSEFEINRANLNAGIYLCFLTDSSGKIIARNKLIIQ